MEKQLEMLKELTELFKLDPQQSELLEALFRQTYSIVFLEGQRDGIKQATGIDVLA